MTVPVYSRRMEVALINARRLVLTLRVAATYMGTVMGAGCASGQEMLQFFVAYGHWGLAGLAVATLAFIVLGYAAMDLGRKLQACSHREILDYACGRRLGWLLDPVITLFLFTSLAVMLAGAGAVAFEQLKVPALLGTWMTVVLTVVTILYGMRGILWANSMVVPALGLSVLGLSLYSFTRHGLQPLQQATSLPHLQVAPTWWVSAFLYVGYNLVLSLSVLGPLGATVADRLVIRWGAILGGLALGVLGLCLKLAVIAHLPDLAEWQVPMLFITRYHPTWVQIGYALIVWAEIYTTAIASAFGFAQRVTQATGWGYKWVMIWACLLAVLGSGMGFANMVGTLYPLLGWASLWVLACLLFTGVFRRTGA